MKVYEPSEPKKKSSDGPITLESSPSLSTDPITPSMIADGLADPADLPIFTHMGLKAPDGAGDSLPRLAGLARSRMPHQRAYALQTLTRILSRASLAQFGDKESSLLLEELLSFPDDPLTAPCSLPHIALLAAQKGGEHVADEGLGLLADIVTGDEGFLMERVNLLLVCQAGRSRDGEGAVGAVLPSGHPLLPTHFGGITTKILNHGAGSLAAFWLHHPGAQTRLGAARLAERIFLGTGGPDDRLPVVVVEGDDREAMNKERSDERKRMAEGLLGLAVSTVRAAAQGSVPTPGGRVALRALSLPSVQSHLAPGTIGDGVLAALGAGVLEKLPTSGSPREEGLHILELVTLALGTSSCCLGGISAMVAQMAASKVGMPISDGEARLMAVVSVYGSVQDRKTISDSVKSGFTPSQTCSFLPILEWTVGGTLTVEEDRDTQRPSFSSILSSLPQLTYSPDVEMARGQAPVLHMPDQAMAALDTIWTFALVSSDEHKMTSDQIISILNWSRPLGYRFRHLMFMPLISTGRLLPVDMLRVGLWPLPRLAATLNSLLPAPVNVSTMACVPSPIPYFAVPHLLSQSQMTPVSLRTLILVTIEAVKSAPDDMKTIAVTFGICTVIRALELVEDMPGFPSSLISELIASLPNTPYDPDLTVPLAASKSKPCRTVLTTFNTSAQRILVPLGMSALPLLLRLASPALSPLEAGRAAAWQCARVLSRGGDAPGYLEQETAPGVVLCALKSAAVVGGPFEERVRSAARVSPASSDLEVSIQLE
eukprot:gnl/Dysnectes_brevis/3408_a4292_767.p1 GENE.gnl/Dysnectes_brevis/3408_a4292_767~~gnl/Dysnectes_brevis/3408_a4292_767.p1  ORF type:complete len:833 (-),score=213.91 gnl/Dysnectes_brevis/3408_a4292_767:112-2421(-)